MLKRVHSSSSLLTDEPTIFLFALVYFLILSSVMTCQSFLEGMQSLLSPRTTTLYGICNKILFTLSAVIDYFIFNRQHQIIISYQILVHFSTMHQRNPHSPQVFWSTVVPCYDWIMCNYRTNHNLYKGHPSYCTLPLATISATFKNFDCAFVFLCQIKICSKVRPSGFLRISWICKYDFSFVFRLHHFWKDIKFTCKLLFTATFTYYTFITTYRNAFEIRLVPSYNHCNK